MITLSDFKMQNSKSNIIISLPLVWSIRNFVLSGIAESLATRFNIYYGVDLNNKKILQSSLGENINVLVIQNGRKLNRIAFLLRKAFLLKHKELEFISAIMKKGNIINTNSNLSKYLKETAYLIAAHIINFLGLFSYLEGVWFKRSERNLDKKFTDQIREINPVFILSTTCVVEIEQPLIFYARGNDIPIFTHILSFDNITSRGYLPIGRFDKYFVWNDLMKEELIHYYNVNQDKIYITGTPQFDFHNSDKFRRSRDETLGMFGLNKNDSYLLYCANHVHLTPGEPALLESIIQEIQGDIRLQNSKLIVRLHPLDNYDRWKSLLEKYSERLRVSVPWSHPVKENTAIGIVTEEDMVKFVNLLRYSDAVLNIASTISIDAAMVDSPVICVGYHPTNPAESECYHNYHFSEHYKKVMEFGATPLATNGKELLSLIHKEIDDRQHLSANRAELASYYVKDYKGSSANSIIKILLDG